MTQHQTQPRPTAQAMRSPRAVAIAPPKPESDNLLSTALLSLALWGSVTWAAIHLFS
jgi:hypothetical protein